MEAVKLPPALELPGAFEIPTHPIQLPNFRTPFWTPIPVYREDIPAINKSGAKTKKKEEEEESEEKPAKKSKVKTEVNPEVNPELNLPQIGMPPIAPPQIQLPPQAAPQREFKEVQKVTLPILEIEVPLPRTEIVVTAVSTAAVASVASVGGTLVATAAFKQIMQVAKPIINIVLKKVAKARGKPKLSWARQRIKDKSKAS